jgi:ubiquitin-activating enzyme E1
MTEINKDLLYSRQIAEIGEKTMGQLSQLNILIIGQKSVGFECSKCLALMGVGNIYLYDYEETNITVNESDIRFTNKDIYGLNFGLNVILGSIKESRKYSVSELTAMYLKTLNPYIQIGGNRVNQNLNSYIEEIKSVNGKEIDCIVITDFNKIKLSHFYEKQIKNNKKVILGFTLGFFGVVHTNFPNHIVYDVNGEPKRTSYLTNISFNGKILKGQLEKNNIFSVGETINYGKVIKSELDNIEIETKEGVVINEEEVFLEEEKEIYSPKFQNWEEINKDINKWNILNIGKNKYPINKVLDFINSPILQSKKKDLPYEDCTLFYEFYPLGSIIGGIIAQEVIKITGKYLPMEQSLIIDGSVLMSDVVIKEKNGLYGNLETLVLGDILSKLKSSRIFMIGAGALGCEHAKNLVMLGGFTIKLGQLTITDPDTISLSNLSRQFLFQNGDIGELKSEVIERKLKSYFPKTKIKSYSEAVSKETYKTVFKYDHWRTHDILLGALDNHEARLYIDKQAIKFEKPLFESGTQGTKCHTQTIIPKKTITYGEIEDPPQESIPMCTIKNFPNNYIHCVEWALEVFHSIFSQTISDIIEIKKDKNSWIEQISMLNNNNIFERISKVNLFLNHLNKPNNEMISGIINEIYEEFYNNPISVLLNSFPEDLEENGKRFWGGKRKRPQLIDIKSSNEFIYGMINGLGKVLGMGEINIEKIELKGEVKEIEDKYTLEELEKNKIKEISSEKVEKLVEGVRNYNDNKLKNMDINILEFEKDNNFTLEILNSIAIQRAKCYKIEIGNINETRRIAGRIIPALSTTTTIVSGLVMLEIMKYLIGSEANDYNINLGINQFIGFETSEAPIKYTGMYNKAYNSKVVVVPDNITVWKKIRVSIIEDVISTVEELIEHLNSEYFVEISMIMYGNEILDNGEQLIKLWSKYGIEYNDSIELQMFINNELPVISAPIYLSH